MPEIEEDRWMGTAVFGVTFFTSSQRNESCGTNGLPLTPNSIRILGRSQYLKSLSHPNLTQYIDIIRGKHERIIVVSEYFGSNLRKILKSKQFEFLKEQDRILRISKQILEALVYLNGHGYNNVACSNIWTEFYAGEDRTEFFRLVMANRNVSLENILFDGKETVKLLSYGLNYITNEGKYISFPIGTPKYIAPEVFASGMKKGPTLYSCDVWSLGIIIIELLLGYEIWTQLKLPQLLQKVVNLRKSAKGVLQEILEEHNATHLLDEIEHPLSSLIEECLTIDPTKRAWPKHLLANTDIFPCTSSDTLLTSEIDLPLSLYKNSRELKFFRSANLMLDSYCAGSETLSIDSGSTAGGNEFGFPKLIDLPLDLLAERTLKEVYYLWQLAGGDVFTELKRQGLTRKKPAVLSLPKLMTLEGESIGKSKERGLLLDQTVIVLPLDELRKRLNDISYEAYYPLIECIIPPLRLQSHHLVKESSCLPLVIREKDIAYQFHRIVLFDRLIKGYPYTKNVIHRECLQDIPPFFRARIWSCLLDIHGDMEYIYNSIDKETPTSTDRQIEVDIPRCHQYDELLASPSGHEKFKRVLKAWVVSNTEYVYWQGLDSLCAPFLYLNFNNEAMAYACLSAFIPKYLYNFFLKDNSVIIQEYLAKFSQLISFHDPQLTNHLDSIGFIPELYAIPWFLTMFSHVFPLHKIFHLWDKLLLGDSSFSLCIGLAILYQLRESLLNSGFNECILLFSDMPEINIEKCVTDSVEIFCSTPTSALCRKHEPFVRRKCMDGGRKLSVHTCEDETSSSYPRVTNDALKMEAIPLPDLKKEKCARISGEDFLQLLDLDRKKFSRPKMIVVDVRNHEDYNRGGLPGSINIPYPTAFSPHDSSLISCHEVHILNENRGKIIAVVGNRGDWAVKFAEGILRLEYPRVCVLHRGIDIFRTSNILVVPSTV